MGPRTRAPLAVPYLGILDLHHVPIVARVDGYPPLAGVVLHGSREEAGGEEKPGQPEDAWGPSGIPGAQGRCGAKCLGLQAQRGLAARAHSALMAYFCAFVRTVVTQVLWTLRLGLGRCNIVLHPTWPN